MKHYLFSALAGLMGAVLFMALHSFVYPQKTIAAVDLNAVLERHIEAVGERELDESELTRSGERFARDLEAAIGYIEQEHNVTILVSGAVVTDVPDFTEYLSTMMERLDGRGN